MEDVEAVLHNEPLEQHLASLEEGERNLVEHCVVERRRPGRLEPARPPHAGQRGEGVPEGGADVAFEGEDEHVVEAHRAEVEHKVEPRPHRARPAHAQQHHLAVRRILSTPARTKRAARRSSSSAERSRRASVSDTPSAGMQYVQRSEQRSVSEMRRYVWRRPAAAGGELATRGARRGGAVPA